MGFIVEKTGSYNLVFQLTTGDNLFSICHRLGPRMPWPGQLLGDTVIQSSANADINSLFSMQDSTFWAQSSGIFFVVVK